MKLLFAALFLFSSSAFAADYWIDGTSGNNSNNGTAKVTAWQTLNAGKQALLAAGDTVTYVGTTANYTNIAISGVNGNAGAYITIRGEQTAAKPFPRVKPASGDSIKVNLSSYIVIEKFEVENDDASTAGNGIRVCGDETSNHPDPSLCHHIIIRKNYIHNITGNGVGAPWGDHIAVIGNRINDSGVRTITISPSGISLYEPRDDGTADGWNDSQLTGYTQNMLVLNNHVSGYRAGVDGIGDEETDGNGIIIDDGHCIQHNGLSGNPDDHCRGTNYVGGFLISGNVIQDNEGRGIHCFQSDNCYIIGNTGFNNCLNQGAQGCGAASDGDVSLLGGTGSVVQNNILLPRSVRRGITQKSSGSVAAGTNSYLCNIYFGGNGFTSVQNGTLTNGGGNLTQDPVLMLNTTGYARDLRPTVGVTPAFGC